jgi:hypothetical protein
MERGAPSASRNDLDNLLESMVGKVTEQKFPEFLRRSYIGRSAS